MNWGVGNLKLGYLTCEHRAGTAQVHTPATGMLAPEFDGCDPIGSKEEQTKAK